MTADPPLALDADPGMIHNVYFWLPEETTAERREAFVESVRSLQAVPTVRRLFVGPPAPTPDREVVDNSFDYALVVWFDDVEGHMAYQEDSIHLAFVKAQEELFERVVVRDNLLSDEPASLPVLE